MSIIVPPGVSGRPANFDVSKVSLDTLANEVALSQLGDIIPLRMTIDSGKFMQEIQAFNADWVDYLPRTDRPNNRKGLTLTAMEGMTHRDVPSLAQASHQAGRKVSELEFNQPTDVYNRCTSLHDFLGMWTPLGRTFLVKSNTGGYFVPHRDHPTMPRQTFRLAVFLNHCAPLEYDWIIGTDQKIQIEQGRAYYINTRLTHRTISWVDDSIHLILNIPFNSENVRNVIANLQHTH